MFSGCSVHSLWSTLFFISSSATDRSSDSVVTCNQSRAQIIPGGWKNMFLPICTWTRGAPTYNFLHLYTITRHKERKIFKFFDMFRKSSTSNITLCMLSKSLRYSRVLGSSWKIWVTAVHAWQAWAMTAPTGHFRPDMRSPRTRTYWTKFDVIPKTEETGEAYNHENK